MTDEKVMVNHENKPVKIEIPGNVILWVKAMEYVKQELQCPWEIALEIVLRSLIPFV